jgi:stalled ribosome rescue protein Dom34
MSVVWLDLEKAKLFHISADRMEREALQVSRVDHHTHRREQEDIERDCLSMCDRIAEKLDRAKGVLILGPGVARTHLLSRLQERFPRVAQKVVGCESSDHPTDQQIAAYAMKYFQRPTG